MTNNPGNLSPGTPETPSGTVNSQHVIGDPVPSPGPGPGPSPMPQPNPGPSAPPEIIPLPQQDPFPEKSPEPFPQPEPDVEPQPKPQPPIQPDTTPTPSPLAITSASAEEEEEEEDIKEQSTVPDVASLEPDHAKNAELPAEEQQFESEPAAPWAAAAGEGETAPEEPSESEPEFAVEPAEDPVILEVRAEAAADETDDLHPQVAFNELSRIELLAALKEVSNSDDAEGNKHKYVAIREAYGKVKEEEVSSKRLKFTENGGLSEDFEVLRDETDTEFEALAKRFQERRAEIRKKKEQELQSNLKLKQNILNELKHMMEKTDNISASFDRLHELQAQWRTIGLVPVGYVDELWKNYHHHINNFYEVIKINKELRELDQKKNLELKTGICVRAEELLMEESIKKSLDEYKALQDQWKDIGQVSREQSEVVWERFRSAGDKLFDRQRQYMHAQEHVFTENLEKKNAIVAKSEALLNELPFTSHPQWQGASDRLAILLEEWKVIGFASRKDNEVVWKKFKTARDSFYESKEVYYKDLRQAQNHNYKLKVDLCMEAEAMKESNDWKKTGDRLRQLQDQWKTIGAVSKKHSEKLWHRFRNACDAFYAQRNTHFAGMNDEQDENLKKKQDLITRIDAFESGEDGNSNFEALKAFQAEWMETGHVPIKEKDKVHKAFRAAIDKQFAKLKSGNVENRRQNFRAQVSNVSSAPGGKDKLHHQRSVVQDKMRRLQTEVQTLENNVGFFRNSKSKAAEDMRNDIEKKINKAKEEIGQLHDQLRILQEA